MALKKIADSGSVSIYQIGKTDEPLQKNYGDMAKALFGTGIAVGDLNADGIVDIVATAPGDANGLIKDTGIVSVLYGNAAQNTIKIYGAAKKQT